MGGGGGKNSTTFVPAQAPDVLTPLAPTRTSAEAMPENYDQALYTGGVKESKEDIQKKQMGTSRLVIPLTGENTQSGGYTQPRQPTGVV